jgi:hypothetical protein
VVRVGENKFIENFGGKNLNDKCHLEDRSVNGRIMFKNVLRSRLGKRIVDTSGSGWRPVTGFYEHGNKHSDSIKCTEFLDGLSNF